MRADWRAGALAGIAAGAVGVGLGEALGAFLGLSPIGAVASTVIDLSPAWLKELVIALADTADKVVLIVCLVLLIIATAVAAGVLETQRTPRGSALLGLLGAAAIVCAATRPDATPVSPLPALAGTAAGIAALRVFVALSRRTDEGHSTPEGRVSRRTFLAVTIWSTVVGAAVAAGVQVAGFGTRTVNAARRMLRLPAPDVAAVPVPAGADLDVEGLSPLITPNADFYRIDTAIFLPVIDLAEWRLRVTGMVEREVELGYEELLSLPLIESHITLACVSNPIGGNLISNATWLGYPVRRLLERARPSPDADMVLSQSADGFTAGTPLSVLLDGRDALLAVGMNGEPLPQEHGFPARLVVPGLYGYVSATKWVVHLEVTRFDRAQAYWTQRGWAAEGPIKLASRIDVPRDGARLAEGPVTVAGVAWEQHTGISGVQVRVDDGPWEDAELAEELTADTWRQWSYRWAATPGSHTVRVRARDAEGRLQDARERGVLPDGATGLHRITVEV